MSVWRCTFCGTTVDQLDGTTMIDPRFRQGYCFICRQRRVFRAESPTSQQRAYARADDPETSWQAADSVSSERIRESQRQVLDILQQHGPLTDEHIFEYIDGRQSVSGARTRRSELVDAGLVRDSGRRDITVAGRKTIVWECCP